MNFNPDKFFDEYKEIQKEMFFSSYEEGKLRITTIQKELLSVNFKVVLRRPEIRAYLFLLENSLLEIAIYNHQSDKTLLRHYRNLLRMSSFYDVESLYIKSLNLADEFLRRGNKELADKILRRTRQRVKSMLKTCKAIISERGF